MAKNIIISYVDDDAGEIEEMFDDVLSCDHVRAESIEESKLIVSHNTGEETVREGVVRLTGIRGL